MVGSLTRQVLYLSKVSAIKLFSVHLPVFCGGFQELGLLLYVRPYVP
jgi:hypothetical protein